MYPNRDEQLKLIAKDVSTRALELRLWQLTLIYSIRIHNWKI